MRIDGQVEPLVREALGAVIAGDPGRWTVAAQAMVDLGFAEAVDLCLAVDGWLLRDLHGGSVRPDEVAALAEAVARMEAWANVDQAEAWRFLMALAQSRDPLDFLPPAEAVQIAFVVGGWLLSAFGPEGQPWEELLDEALDALESKVLQGSFVG